MDGFCQHKPDYRNNYTSYKRVDTMQQFIRTICQTDIGSEQPAFLVTEKKRGGGH